MDVQRAAELYAQDWTLRQIGAELGVHCAAVSHQLHRAGVTMRRGGPPAHPTSTQQILELRDKSLIVAVLCGVLAAAYADLCTMIVGLVVTKLFGDVDRGPRVCRQFGYYLDALLALILTSWATLRLLLDTLGFVTRLDLACDIARERSF